jgi:GalNAc-alpha-(1->4)-GalNAc-alpha-(1->3)-diNAcBac-PP-undecaprenol alpha-1,4-N-acetyl-D-galactosaminyltransferase
MRITLVIATLRLGGAERVASLLGNAFDDSGHDVTIITRTKDSDFYLLNGNIKRVNLPVLKSSRTPFGSFLKNNSLIRNYTRALDQIKPDIIISFMNRTNIRVLRAVKRRSYPLIISEHNYPPANPLGQIWEHLRKKWYPRADHLVALSRGTDDFFDYLPTDKKSVIHNPVSFMPAKEVGNRKKRFISAGRLHRVKNYHFLIECFSMIADELPDWDLVILGEGEERHKLEEQIQVNGLSDRVLLPGKVDNVPEYFADSSVFCLTSDTEGLGNVIIEAMGSGLPVISLDCPTGPGEIIRNRDEGILIPMGDKIAFSRKMLELANDHSLRQNLIKHGLIRSQDFSMEKIYPQWEELINRVVGNG